MIFIVDTSSFSVFRNYYPSAFPSFWEFINALADDGTIRSVKEVFNELQNDNRVVFYKNGRLSTARYSLHRPRQS